MNEKVSHSEKTLSDKEYTTYKSALQDFALSCVFSSNVLYGNPFIAETARPFEVDTTGDVEKQLAIRDSKSASKDSFLALVSSFHSALGNHDTARAWAQHVEWPLRRFDVLMVAATNEKSVGKDPKETVQSAKDSLEEIPVGKMTNSLKPELAASWAKLAYVESSEKNQVVYLATAKSILNSLYHELEAHPSTKKQRNKQDSLTISVAKAYFVCAQVSHKLSFNPESFLKLADEYADKVLELEEKVDLFWRTRLTRPEWTDVKWNEPEDDKDSDSVLEMTVDEAQKMFKHSTNSWQRWISLINLIKVGIKEDFFSVKSLEEAELLSSQFEIGLQVRSLLHLAQLAADAGINPIHYTDKVRHIIYQKLIKSYKTSDMFEDLAETEVNIARTLMKRCSPTLVSLGREQMEQLTIEAIRLNDKDCLKALGAFLPLDIQAKYISRETESLFFIGRAMRGVW